MTPTTAAATTGPEAVHVAAARGYLTAALTAIPRQHEAVLELSAAWSELAEPARLPEVTDPQPGRDGDTPAVLLAAARTALLSRRARRDRPGPHHRPRPGDPARRRRDRAAHLAHRPRPARQRLNVSRRHHHRRPVRRPRPHPTPAHRGRRGRPRPATC